MCKVITHPYFFDEIIFCEYKLSNANMGLQRHFLSQAKPPVVVSILQQEVFFQAFSSNGAFHGVYKFFSMRMWRWPCIFSDSPTGW